MKLVKTCNLGITLAFVFFVASLMLMFNFATANAQDKNINAENQQIVGQLTTDPNEVSELPSGIAIWKSPGVPATEGQKDFEGDFQVVGDQIRLFTDGLIIEGTQSNINCGFVVYDTVDQITLKNLDLNYDYSHSVFNIWDVNPSTEISNGAPGFTLNIEGNCKIRQTKEESSIYRKAISYEMGNTDGFLTVTGGEGSYLECSSLSSDVIWSSKKPIKFSGDLTAKVEIYGENTGYAVHCDNQSDLILSDNVKVACISNGTIGSTAIYANNLDILNNASLYVQNNNSDTMNFGAIHLSGNFTVDTTGRVIIYAANPWSWQAVYCQGNMSILNCAWFSAIAEDYTAVDVCGNFAINTPNVYLSGRYTKPNNNAWRGAFTVKDINKLSIAPWLNMYGNEDFAAEDCLNRAFIMDTHGYDVDTIYTPFEFDIYTHPKIARTVTFKGAIHPVIFIPGKNPTYAEAGYKYCFKSANSNEFYEDYFQIHPILDYFYWRTYGEGHIPALSEEFDSYREDVKANCEALIAKGDVPEVRALIDVAKANIDAYVYDDAKSMDENKAAIDAIYTQLVQEIQNLPIPPWPGPVPPQPIPPQPGPNPDVTGGVSPQTSDSGLLYIFALIFVLSGVLIVSYKKFSSKN